MVVAVFVVVAHVTFVAGLVGGLVDVDVGRGVVSWAGRFVFPAGGA